MCGFVEIIEKGAFADALKSSDVRALFNHDDSLVLGRQSAGTLKLYEDEIGLRYEITPPDTQFARDLIVSLQRGDIKESSFAFSMKNGAEQWQDNATPIIRKIIKIGEIFDISPVTYPAYPATTSGISTRSLEDIYNIYKSKNTNGIINEINIKREKLNLALKS